MRMGPKVLGSSRTVRTEEESDDYNTDGSDDLDLPERLRPSVAVMARRAAARYPLPI